MSDEHHPVFYTCSFSRLHLGNFFQIFVIRCKAVSIFRNAQVLRFDERNECVMVFVFDANVEFQGLSAVGFELYTTTSFA